MYLVNLVVDVGSNCVIRKSKIQIFVFIVREDFYMINGRKERVIGIGDIENEKGIILEESLRVNFL